MHGSSRPLTPWVALMFCLCFFVFCTSAFGHTPKMATTLRALRKPPSGTGRGVLFTCLYWAQSGQRHRVPSQGSIAMKLFFPEEDPTILVLVARKPQPRCLVNVHKLTHKPIGRFGT